MRKKRKLTVTVIDMGSNVEIINRVQCVKGGRGGKEGRESIGNGGINIARYYKGISGSKKQKMRKLTIAVIH
jgi:hypothetical protein